MNNPIDFPEDIPVSDSAKDLILKLLNRNQEKRLGSKNGINELLNHQFYRHIDIHKMINQQVREGNFIIIFIFIFKIQF